jgi:hypothetical protein
MRDRTPYDRHAELGSASISEASSVVAKMDPETIQGDGAVEKAGPINE